MPVISCLMFLDYRPLSVQEVRLLSKIIYSNYIDLQLLPGKNPVTMILRSKQLNLLTSSTPFVFGGLNSS